MASHRLETRFAVSARPVKTERHNLGDRKLTMLRDIRTRDRAKKHQMGVFGKERVGDWVSVHAGIDQNERGLLEIVRR